jgi:hypothetical protein
MGVFCLVRWVNFSDYTVPEAIQLHEGGLTFSPLAFGPSDNSTHMILSMDTGSQKRLILVTNVPQSGPTVRPYKLVPL